MALVRAPDPVDDELVLRDVVEASDLVAIVQHVLEQQCGFLGGAMEEWG